MTKDALILLWCLILASLAALAATILQNPARAVSSVSAQPPAQLSAISISDNALQAKSAVLYDAKTGTILYEKNAEMQWPLASLTKLASAHAVLTAGEDKLVTIRAQDIAAEGDSHLKAGDVWRLGDLVAFSLTSSSNDGMTAASQVLTREGTILKMNAAAALAGLEQSYFLNPTGLDQSSSTAGAYGSAIDVARLVVNLLRDHGRVFMATTEDPIPNGKSGKGAVSTLRPLWSLPGLIAAKTGYTDLAGGNLAAAVDLGINQPVVVVVLGSTEKGRFEDVETIITAARDAQIQQTNK